MYFDFEGRHFDTPTIESALTWRDQLLLSIIAHAVAVVLVLLVPRLPFVAEAAARRAERLAELAQLQAEQQMALLDERDEPTFVFIEPLVELEATEPPQPNAVPSDRDRIAMSPERAEDPSNDLAFADGNSPEFVVREDLDDGPDEAEAAALDGLDAESGTEAEVPEEQLAEETAGQDEELDQVAEVADEPGRPTEFDESGRSVVADSSLTLPGTGPGDPDSPSERTDDIEDDGLLTRAMENLRRSVDEQTFLNRAGDPSRYGPWIQFDSKGVEFGPWIRRFAAQIRRNWFVPYAAMTMHGHVVLTFYVHRDGTISELQVVRPSGVDAFNNAAFNALLSSNPTQNLPEEYPDDRAFFTVTFFYNESPPLQ